MKIHPLIASWSAAHPPVAAASPAGPGPGGPVDRAELRGDEAPRLNVKRSGLSGALAALRGLVGLPVAPEPELAPVPAPAAPPPQPPPENLGLSALQGDFELAGQRREPLVAGLGKLRGLTDYQSGKPIAIEEAVRQLGQGKSVSLEGNEAQSLEEARLYLHIQDHLEASELADPALGGLLKHLVKEEFAAPDRFPLKPYRALKLMRELQANPNAQIEICDLVGSGNNECFVPVGAFSGHELRDPQLPARLAEGREALLHLFRSAHTEVSPLWRLIREPERNHEGVPLAVRAELAVHLKGIGWKRPEVYDATAGLARELGAEKALKWAQTVRGLSGDDALLALEQARGPQAEAFRETLARMEDPVVSLAICQARQDPEKEAAYQILAQSDFGGTSKKALLRAWARAGGNVDVGDLDRPGSKYPKLEFLQLLWSEVPREKHELYLRFGPLEGERGFKEVRAAAEAVRRDGPEHVEDRFQAHQAWSAHTPHATEILQAWPSGPISERDRNDFAVMLASRRGEQQPTLSDWPAVAAAPSRDLALSLYLTRQDEQGEELARAGFAQPDSAAALRRLLTDCSIRLEPALDAVARLRAMATPERPLDSLVGDYLQLRSQLASSRQADFLALTALRHAGAARSEALVAAHRATGDLPTSLALLPELDRPGGVADVQLAGDLARSEGAPTVVSLTRLLGAGPLEDEQRQALRNLSLKSPVLPQLEDLLGQSAPPADGPLTRLARGGELLARTLPPEEAAPLLAQRLSAALGGDWSATAEQMVRAGPHTVAIARLAQSPEELRAAVGLLSRLDPPDSWPLFVLPLGSETFGERCQLASRWVEQTGKQAAESWELLAGRQEGSLEAGLSLRAPLALFGESCWPDAIRRLQSMQRRGQVSADFTECAAEFRAALDRLGGRALLQGYNLDEVVREMLNPKQVAAKAGGLRESSGSVTLPGVQLRKRSS